MIAPDARDQQVLNRPACALSASVLTRMAAKMLGIGTAAIKTLSLFHPEGARGLHRRADIQHSLAMARLPGLADSFPRNRAERFSRRGPAFRRGLQFPVVEQGHKAPVELVLPVPRRLVVYQDGVKLTYRQASCCKGTQYRAELPGLAGVQTRRRKALFLQHLPE